MPDISITKSHQLSLEDAKAAAQKFADKLAEKFDMTTVWEDNALSFASSGVSGKLNVDAEHATVEVELGMFFKFFKEKIEEQITHNMDKMFCSK